MPESARVQGQRGRLSYTVHSRTGAVVEVLLKGRAFMIKKTAMGDLPKQVRISWKDDVDKAWAHVKDICGWEFEHAP